MATLQLEINYPKIFGGTWSTSPDPSDFHNFTGPDLYAPDANVYTRPDGAARPIMRASGKVIATLEQFAELEAVLGPYGGQMSSFDWVSSPKGESGAPEPMFDRKTGAVNAKVVAYWHGHYDLAHIVEADWAARGRYLKGRIHLLVGTADTFYLDGSAHLFKAVLNGASFFLSAEQDAFRPLYGWRGQAGAVRSDQRTDVCDRAAGEEVEVRNDREMTFFADGLGPGKTSWKAGLPARLPAPHGWMRESVRRYHNAAST